MAGLQILPPGTLEENPSLLLWRGGILDYTLLSLPTGKTAYSMHWRTYGLLGAVMLMMGGIATLRGLSVQKVTAAHRLPLRPCRRACAHCKYPGNSWHLRSPPMVDRLGSFSYTRTDEDRIKKISLTSGRLTKSRVDDLNLQAGHVERGKIPEYTRETIDYLLDDHVPTHDATLANFSKRRAKLRETIIRILGAMGRKMSYTR